MIIKRKYATAAQICDDGTTKQAVLKVFDDLKVPDDVRVFVFDPDSSIMISNSNMRMFMGDAVYEAVMKRLDELDMTDPFENLLNYSNVDKVISIPGKKDGTLMQIMYTRQSGKPVRVVQVLAFETVGDRTELIEPWDADNVALV
ncbi:MAG: hypothetical protein J6W36_05530 [Clostridiales bacterium]|nr:hypothetical protein [Clostridiales bacterium]